MITNGKTSVIDSDFRAGAIFYSLTNALLFSFALTNTVIYGKLTAKNNKLDGVNVLAMSIISGIVSIISGALVIYSIYKLIMVREKRDQIETELKESVPPEYKPPVTIDQPEFKNIRDINANISGGPSPFANMEREFRPSVNPIASKGFF